MPTLCRFACLAASLFSVAAAAQAADTINLSADLRPGQLAQVKFQMEVGGQLKMVRDGKVSQTPMKVDGKSAYRERLLAAADGSRVSRSVRKYDSAAGTLTIERRKLTPELSSPHRLIVASVGKDAQTLFCPTGLLTRDELDLIDVPCSTLLINRLLPGKTVKLGDTWRHQPEDLALLLGLDAVSQADVESVVSQLKDGEAEMALAGTVAGAVGGVATDIELKAKYRFNQVAGRIDWLAMLIKENRSVGHAAPGVDVVAKLQVQIDPLAKAEDLSEAALAGVPLEPAPELTRLAYVSPSGELSMAVNRGWQVVNEDGQIAVLRLVERGDLLAQCNATRLPPLASGNKLSLADFQTEVRKALGDNFRQFAEAAELTSGADYHVLRVVAQGSVSDLPIEWRYYHITDRSGRRASLAFTISQQFTERFGENDQELALGLRLMEPTVGAPTTAAKPSPLKLKAK
ncbi:MAG: hypothetical protein U0836_23760 [Pirellulales bacterium]